MGDNSYRYVNWLFTKKSCRISKTGLTGRYNYKKQKIVNNHVNPVRKISC